MTKIRMIFSLVLLVSGCGSIANYSSIKYKTPVLTPAVDRTAQGPGRCYFEKAFADDGSNEVVDVSFSGTPENVAVGYGAVNGSNWQNAGMFMYDCALAETSYYSVGGNSYWNGQNGNKEGELALKAVVTFLKKVRGDSTPAEAPAPVPAPEPAPLTDQPAPAPAPNAPAAPAPTAASAAPAPTQPSACQEISGAQSFAGLADVVEKLASASADQSSKDLGRQLAKYLRDEGVKPNPDPSQLQALKDTMKAEYRCQ